MEVFWRFVNKSASHADHDGPFIQFSPLFGSAIEIFYDSNGALLALPPPLPTSSSQRLLAAYGPRPRPMSEHWEHDPWLAWLAWWARRLFQTNVMEGAFYCFSSFPRVGHPRFFGRWWLHKRLTPYFRNSTLSIPSKLSFYYRPARRHMFSGQWGLIFRVGDDKSRPPALQRFSRCAMQTEKSKSRGAEWVTLGLADTVNERCGAKLKWQFSQNVRPFRKSSIWLWFTTSLEWPKSIKPKWPLL